MCIDLRRSVELRAKAQSQVLLSLRIQAIEATIPLKEVVGEPTDSILPTTTKRKMRWPNSTRSAGRPLVATPNGGRAISCFEIHHN